MDKQDKPIVNITVTEWVVILFKIFIASMPAWILAVMVYILLGGVIAGLLPNLSPNKVNTSKVGHAAVNHVSPSGH